MATSNVDNAVAWFIASFIAAPERQRLSMLLSMGGVRHPKLLLAFSRSPTFRADRIVQVHKDHRHEGDILHEFATRHVRLVMLVTADGNAVEAVSPAEGLHEVLGWDPGALLLAPHAGIAYYEGEVAETRALLALPGARRDGGWKAQHQRR